MVPTAVHAADCASKAPSCEVTQNPKMGVHTRLTDEVEPWKIQRTLEMTGGNREEAARILKIGERTLYRKLEKYGLK